MIVITVTEQIEPVHSSSYLKKLDHQFPSKGIYRDFTSIRQKNHQICLHDMLHCKNLDT